jgi:hypothetical protein
MNLHPMKTSILVTTLILAGVAALGWQKQNAIGRLRELERDLISRAAAAGVSRTPGPHERHAKKSRVDREEEARETAAKLITNLKEAAVLRPGETEDQMSARVSTINDGIFQLSGLELRVLIHQLRDTPDLVSFRSSIDAAIMALAETDPAAAMGMIAEGRDLAAASASGFSDLSYQAFELNSHVIGKWAATDPLSAIEWSRNHPEFRKFAGFRETKELILGVAANDPRMAFRLIPELKPPNYVGEGEGEGSMDFDAYLTLQIARTARSLEERTTMLALVREMAGNSTISESAVKVAMRAMANGLATHGHEKATAWLASANLRPNEAAWFRDSFVNARRGTNPEVTGRLIEWFPAPASGE